MAAAGSERRGVAGRALCLLLLCGWSLAARGQDSPGERRGAGRGGWLRAVGTARPPRRSASPVCSVGPGALCVVGRRGSCIEVTGPGPGPGFGLSCVWGWAGGSERWAVRRGRAASGRGKGGRLPGVHRFCCCEEQFSWLLHSSDLGFLYSVCVSDFSLPSLGN